MYDDLDKAGEGCNGRTTWDMVIADRMQTIKKLFINRLNSKVTDT